MTKVPPLVSICIPTHNGARWIERSLRSAISQTYQPVEILIVDDASTDDTVNIATWFRDPRIRVEVNKSNLGLVRNWNRCITLSKGSLVKLLFQDDMLYPTCVEKMALLFEKHPLIGMVFSPRDILLEDPHDPVAIEWKKQYGTLHTRFSPLREVNRGQPRHRPVQSVAEIRIRRELGWRTVLRHDQKGMPRTNRDVQHAHDPDCRHRNVGSPNVFL